MILSDFLRALGQFDDARFRRVLWLGIGLTLLLLIAVYAGFVGAIALFVPDSVTLPWIGAVGHIDLALSVASAALMLLASVFLMAPVASAFSGLFLDQVAEAVEARHYPALPRPRPVGWGEALGDGARFFAIVLAVNLVALGLSFFIGPLAPVLFWAVNGYLLGRENFQMAAMRRMTPGEARALARRYPLQIWLAGVLMALPLTVPVINLVVPILGAASFTHTFHRLNAKAGGGLTP